MDGLLDAVQQDKCKELGGVARRASTCLAKSRAATRCPPTYQHRAGRPMGSVRACCMH